MKNKFFPFWIFTVSVFIVLLVPPLVRNGMFLDGLVYASIARNMSQGIGNFWAMEYSNTLCSPFYDQLPLAVWLQSLFFRLFGDHLFVERFYSFITALLTAFIITRIWKILFLSNKAMANLDWLPVLFWIITPVVFWSYSNNMLDNTVVVFSYSAVYFTVSAFSVNRFAYIKLFFAGVFILAAFLSKGPIGIFPMACVILYGLCFRNISTAKLFIGSTILLVVPLILLGIMLLFMDHALFSFNQYFNQQVVLSLKGERDLAPGRFYIIARLGLELTIMCSIAFFVIIFSKFKKVKTEKSLHNRKVFSFLLLTAVAASFPIVFSLKQSGYYLLPSLSFFAMAVALPVAEKILPYIQNLKPGNAGFKITGIVLTLLFFCTIIYSVSQIGNVSRDKELVSDTYHIGKLVPAYSTVSVCFDMMDDWGIHAYMMRYHCIKLDYRKQYDFFILDSNCSKLLPEGYVRLQANTFKYQLYKKK